MAFRDLGLCVGVLNYGRWQIFQNWRKKYFYYFLLFRFHEVCSDSKPNRHDPSGCPRAHCRKGGKILIIVLRLAATCALNGLFVTITCSWLVQINQHGIYRSDLIGRQPQVCSERSETFPDKGFLGVSYYEKVVPTRNPLYDQKRTNQNQTRVANRRTD